MSNWSLTHLLTKRKEQACWDLSLTYFLTWRLTRNKNRTSFTYESPVNTSLLTKKSSPFLYLPSLFHMRGNFSRECAHLSSLQNTIAIQKKWSRGKHLNLISSSHLFLGSKWKFLTIPSAWTGGIKQKKKNEEEEIKIHYKILNSQIMFISADFFNVT